MATTHRTSSSRRAAEQSPRDASRAQTVPGSRPSSRPAGRVQGGDVERDAGPAPVRVNQPEPTRGAAPAARPQAGLEEDPKVRSQRRAEAAKRSLVNEDEIDDPLAPATRRVTGPPETEAQRAAGPHRPEPARQVKNTAGVALAPAARQREVRPVMKVQATQTGYYGEMRRRPGDVFWLTDNEHFSDTWMRQVSSRTPERVTTGQQQIRKEHDERIVAQRAGATLPAAQPEGLPPEDDDRIDAEP